VSVLRVNLPYSKLHLDVACHSHLANQEGGAERPVFGSLHSCLPCDLAGEETKVPKEVMQLGFLPLISELSPVLRS
jgi:hypothetical protein